VTAEGKSGKHTKYIFVTGGVVSSIGKGITTASIGRLLRNRGFSVCLQKMDPYINVDAGTMNPYQHGEVFVTDDGAETDLDLGHYERFVDINLTRQSNVTTGGVYGSVIAKERRGEYLGACVQVIPHITDEIKARARRLPRDTNAEIAIVEIGGTVGDIEGQPFLEAIRQFRSDVGPQNVLFIHITLVPTVGPWAEAKTKPTQHSVIKLREVGIKPDILVCRSTRPMTPGMFDKIALFCDVSRECVIEAADTRNIYAVPLIFEEGGMSDLIVEHLGLGDGGSNLDEWRAINRRIEHPVNELNIAIVGKYTHLRDSYISVVEAARHAGIAADSRINIKWFEADDLVGADPGKVFAGIDGMIVPGGFGMRGVEGKVEAIRYARTRKIPFLGLCLGLQCVVVEFARNVCGLAGANSSEFDDETPHPVIHLMPSQEGIEDKGGTMRLGLYPCKLREGSRVAELYDQQLVYERHRHRYEVNNEYRPALESNGLACSGVSPDDRLVEMVEIPEHPYFVATQAHPEFKSRPNNAHPMFYGLIRAALAAKGIGIDRRAPAVRTSA
jgi:CTP synthase